MQKGFELIVVTILVFAGCRSSQDYTLQFMSDGEMHHRRIRVISWLDRPTSVRWQLLPSMPRIEAEASCKALGDGFELASSGSLRHRETFRRLAKVASMVELFEQFAGNVWTTQAIDDAGEGQVFNVFSGSRQWHAANQPTPALCVQRPVPELTAEVGVWLDQVTGRSWFLAGMGPRVEADALCHNPAESGWQLADERHLRESLAFTRLGAEKENPAFGGWLASAGAVWLALEPDENREARVFQLATGTISWESENNLRPIVCVHTDVGHESTDR